VPSEINTACHQNTKYGANPCWRSRGRKAEKLAKHNEDKERGESVLSRRRVNTKGKRKK
jgi:hypothetical protein